MIDRAVRFLQQHDDLILIAHISPDGDTLGSSLALFCGLKQLGKRVQVACADPVPPAYRFCPQAEAVQLPQALRQTDAVVTVDCADKLRTGTCAPLFERAKYTLNIDHHGTNRGFAQENWVMHAGATGELVYRILEQLSVTVDVEIASLLYVALASDTGNFAYSNTSPDTFRIAAKLLERGIDLPELNRRLFRTKPYRKLLLQSRAVGNCMLHAEGRIAISTLTLADLAACGAGTEDSEGLIDNLRDIDTVEIAALLHEENDGSVRVSLRGKRTADVGRIAVRFGGGGHRLAAGCTMYVPIAQAAGEVLSAALEILEEEAH